MAIEEDPPPSVPEWVVTFGDMMSLLLTFFIMLVSMSEIKMEDDKFQALVESLRAKFGDDVERLRMSVGTGQPASTKANKMVAKMRQKWDNSADLGSKIKAPPGNQHQVRSIRPGDQVMIGGFVPFAHLSASLSPEGVRDLALIVDQLRGKPQMIELRGHVSCLERVGTDDAWDLAYARCRETLNYLITEGIDRRRIRISVAADNEPRNGEDDPLLTQENSRVEVFMTSDVPPRATSGAPIRAEPTDIAKPTAATTTLIPHSP